jgi:hypothetical protein
MNAPGAAGYSVPKIRAYFPRWIAHPIEGTEHGEAE